MSHHDNDRLELELELLEAMYPEQVCYNARSRDLKFLDGSASLELRIPANYPGAGFPDVIAARDTAKNDIRQQAKAAVQGLGLVEGEEALDAVMACFQQIVQTNKTTDLQTGADTSSKIDNTALAPEASKTVIIWLHHLLALSKRKLALSPASLAGITKPGYPGVMVFTGPLSIVSAHVNTLKAENWQAFQVRYDSEELWELAHGDGIREVETMAEVVQAIGAGENGARRKKEFLEAVGIK